MDDSQKIKILSWMSFVALLLAASSIALTAGSLKKGNFRGSPANVSQIPDEQNNSSPAAQSDDNSQKATGFVGLPMGETKSGVESNLKKFALKGHWLFNDKPGFDYASKDENAEVIVVINENTKILKAVVPADKTQKPAAEEISFKDFKIESQSNPYLAIWDEPTSSSFQAVLAKEIRIFPLEVK